MALYQLMKTLQDERLRAAARDHLAAEARRARTAGRDHAAARGVTAGADEMAGVQLAGMLKLTLLRRSMTGSRGAWGRLLLRAAGLPGELPSQPADHHRHDGVQF
jgi:hypothetical protein